MYVCTCTRVCACACVRRCLCTCVCVYECTHGLLCVRVLLFGSILAYVRVYVCERMYTHTREQEYVTPYVCTSPVLGAVGSTPPLFTVLLCRRRGRDSSENILWFWGSGQGILKGGSLSLYRAARRRGTSVIGARRTSGCGGGRSAPRISASTPVESVPLFARPAGLRTIRLPELHF